MSTDRRRESDKAFEVRDNFVRTRIAEDIFPESSRVGFGRLKFERLIVAMIVTQP